jgi:hypothetical protein
MLDRWQKIVDISLKGFATVLLAIGTYLLAAQRLNFDRSGFCATFIQQSFEFVQGETFTDARKSMLDFRIERHNAVCGPLEPQYVQALNNAWRAPTTLAEAQTGSPTTPVQPANPRIPDNTGNPPVTSPALEVEQNLDRAQWVAISRKNDSNYSAVNFDVVRGAEPVHRVGNVLRARWFVNIRAANTPVVDGNNPVIGQILGGQCVRVLGQVSGTLNEWGRVERINCPA